MCTRLSAGSLSLAASPNGMERAAVCALCFANRMIFTQDILDREDIVQHRNDDPTVNAKVTYGPAIVQMVAPNLSGLRRQHFHPYIFRDIGVCENN